MVTEITRTGMIVTMGARHSDAINALAASCNWPVLADANARQLFREIELTRPTCLLFWLDAARHIVSTAELISRLRDRGPRPYRVAVVHRLKQDVEGIFRAAGVHGYLSTSGDIASFVADALLPLLNLQIVPAHFPSAANPLAQPSIRGPTNIDSFPVATRPP